MENTSPDPGMPAASVATMLRDYSIGVTARGQDVAARCAGFLAPGTATYIAAFAGDDPTRRVALAAGLGRAGFVAVPHICARFFTSAAMLDAHLAGLADAGVSRALIVSGDLDPPAGPFEDGLDLLWTGLPRKHGIIHIGLPWYIEGHPIMSEDESRSALIQKIRYIRDNGMHGWLVSQICLAAPPYVARARQVRALGIDVPLQAGIAGPCDREAMIRFATRCRIGNSIRLLSPHVHQTEHLIDTTAPQHLLAEIAAMQSDHAARFAGVHIFNLGGLKATASWLRAMLT